MQRWFIKIDYDFYAKNHTNKEDGILENIYQMKLFSVFSEWG